jgi:signal transduction histidine kinase
MAKPNLQALRTDPQERGLARLSLDLHDGPIQDLAAVGFSLDRLRQELEAVPGDTSILLMQIDGIVEQLAVVELALRSVVERGAPESPVSTLATLVEDEVARFASLDGATVDLRLDAAVEPATDSQLIALHRVLREALTNVHKHAQATHVEIDLYLSGDVIHLEVTDDGVGFDPARRKRGGGFGLDGMQARLRLLGSDFSVASRPGGPTTVAAAVRRWRP